MKITQIAHVAFTCRDVETTAAFYREKLGFRDKFRLTYGDFIEHIAKAGNPLPEWAKAMAARRGEVWIIYMELNGQFVELFDHGDATLSLIPDAFHYNFRHFSLVSDDLEALRGRLLSSGVKITSDIRVGVSGAKQMWIADPDGNPIELMEYLPECKQNLCKPEQYSPTAQSHLFNIGHLAFSCPDLEVSEAYYTAIGFKKLFTMTYKDLMDHRILHGETDEPSIEALRAKAHIPWIVYMELNGQFIELFEKDNAREYARSDGQHFNYDHVAILTDDIHALHTYFLTAGLPVESAPSLGLEGTWQMWSHDPDGNRIEFMQYTPTSWQLTGKPDNLAHRPE